MESRRDDSGQGPIVTGFAGRGFRVRDDLFPNGLLLSPVRAMAWDDAPTVDALTLAALGDLLDGDPRPEFLLLGTGAGLRQPPRAFVRDLEAKGIGLEAMDSRAAARAWGVLRAEERSIVAALLPL
ncbi:Mth938-like domain-containing protein [Sphingobium sp. Ant17]|uniref:Mth938-like domain-containing protein n=1 Tax=Sphingobium sp. Ant17 TaxID=1461752 RepID=UPI0004B73918|nr:Mth938-like domain-containing protein [Sphingobium sp. Ant17]